MIGAIIGDIIGSVYEWNNIKTKDFPLFNPKCTFTDDTVMTLAIAEGLMNGGGAEDFVQAMKKYGRLYRNSGYGGQFGSWLFSEETKPYKSWGNGSAMRVSPVAWLFDTLPDVEKYAEISAAVTHNHPEGIKGAQATAAAIFLARKTKNEIKAYVESKYGYDLSRSLNEIRPKYQFNESCQETVPEAIIAFLESVDFEDAIRNAISLGGDSDTLAAITGSIAEAAYIVPEEIKEKALSILDECLLKVYRQFIERLQGSKNKKDEFPVHFTSFGGDGYVITKEDRKVAKEWIEEFVKKGLLHDPKNWKPIELTYNHPDYKSHVKDDKNLTGIDFSKYRMKTIYKKERFSTNDKIRMSYVYGFTDYREIERIHGVCLFFDKKENLICTDHSRQSDQDNIRSVIRTGYFSEKGKKATRVVLDEIYKITVIYVDDYSERRDLEKRINDTYSRKVK